MTSRRPTQQPDELERELFDLGAQLDWPAKPDLLPAVRQRIQAQPPAANRLARLQPRLIWPAAALIAIVLVVVALSDATRSTVADRLGLSGVSISTQPTATIDASNALLLGTPVSLDDAVTRGGEALVQPPVSMLGVPDATYMIEQDGFVQVSYVYDASAELPAVADTDVGLLISQIDGATNSSFIQKQLGPKSTIEMVEVGGNPAFWITGAPHVFYYERLDGKIIEESIRLAGNVLLWEQDGKTLRIETALDREQAVQIAEAMTP